MNHLRNFLLSLPIALSAMLPIGADAKSSNDFQILNELRQAGVSIQASVRPAASSAILQQSAQQFFTAYQQATQSAAATDALLNLLTDNVEMTFVGQPGEMLPFAGVFVGHVGVANVMKAIRAKSTTRSFQVRELLTTTFAVDFSLLPQNPLIPQDNRVAAILEEVRAVDGGVEARHRFELTKRRIPLAEYGEFQNALRAIQLAEQRTVRLELASKTPR